VSWWWWWWRREQKPIKMNNKDFEGTEHERERERERDVSLFG
jgi:hypothetical protein